MKKNLFIGFFLFCFLITSLSAKESGERKTSISITRDHISGNFSLKSNKTEIRKILVEIAKRSSCQIYIQKSINKEISLDYKNITLEKLFKKLTREYHVVLQFDSVTGDLKGGGLKSVKIFETEKNIAEKELEKLSSDGIFAKKTEKLKKEKKRRKYSLVKHRYDPARRSATFPNSLSKIVTSRGTWERVLRNKRFNMMSKVAQANQTEKYIKKTMDQKILREARETLGNEKRNYTYYPTQPMDQGDVGNMLYKTISAYKARAEYQKLNSPELIKQYQWNPRAVPPSMFEEYLQQNPMSRDQYGGISREPNLERFEQSPKARKIP